MKIIVMGYFQRLRSQRRGANFALYQFCILEANFVFCRKSDKFYRGYFSTKTSLRNYGGIFQKNSNGGDENGDVSGVYG